MVTRPTFFLKSKERNNTNRNKIAWNFSLIRGARICFWCKLCPVWLNILLLGGITVIWNVCLLNWPITAISVAPVTGCPCICLYCSGATVLGLLIFLFFLSAFIWMRPKLCCSLVVFVPAPPPVECTISLKESEILWDTWLPHLPPSYIRPCEYQEILGCWEHTWFSIYRAWALLQKLLSVRGGMKEWLLYQQYEDGRQLYYSLSINQFIFKN